MRYAAAPKTSTTTTMTVTVMATMLPALKACGTSSMVTPVEGVLLPSSAMPLLGLATVSEGDVGSMARLDTAIVPGEGTSFISADGWVGMAGESNAVPGDECRVLLSGEEEEKDAGVPTGLGFVPKSVVPLARLECAVQGLKTVSRVGGTELGATDRLSAAVTVFVGVEAVDRMAVVLSLRPPTSGDTPLLVGPSAVRGVD